MVQLTIEPTPTQSVVLNLVGLLIGEIVPGDVDTMLHEVDEHMFEIKSAPEVNPFTQVSCKACKATWDIAI